jgi:tetratricopeptide (TPR) repeat protein
VALALNNLGVVAHYQGDSLRAAALLEECLALRRALGNTQGIASALSGLGRVAEGLGDYPRAAALLEESLALNRELGDRGGIAESLSGFGMVAYRQGEYRRAAALYAESIGCSHEIGARALVAEGLEGLAWVADAGGQAQRAARLGGAAQALREALGMPLPLYQQDGHDQAVTAMRAVLGEGAFTLVWAAGAALSPEQAVAMALDEPSGAEIAVIPVANRPTRARSRPVRRSGMRDAVPGGPSLRLLPSAAPAPPAPSDDALGDNEQAQ